ncbi:accessory regulator AgrB [Paenibacillus sambharensis]|uniref:Accessory regulator AgrB n=1 Tax=Paenibacillus sambharensis TaxID=1803190 RepID=A0A2W1LMY2_9BACL|nr:accessory gene regulator B family protein [Paenibacillus sambharensis]PZD93151.1 accessory regulator AgrB [Paenibacillus sambharensis]
MIQVFSQRLAESIKAAVPDHPASINVLRYSISFLINALSVIFISTIAGLITGKIAETAIVLVSFALLRQVSGGYHLKSGGLCIAISSALMIVIAQVQLADPYVMLFNCLSALLVLFYAPSRIERQTRIPHKYYPLLKILALLLVAISTVINKDVLAAALLAQSLTLIHRKAGG